MRLFHPLFSVPIPLEEGQVTTLVVESPTLFQRMLLDLHQQCSGQTGEFVLSQDYCPIKFSGEIELILQPLFLDFANRKIKSKILADLESAAQREDMYLSSYEIQSAVSTYLGKLLDTSEAPLTYSFELGVLLKAADIKVDFEEASPAECLCLYLELMTTLHLSSCFVLVNAKSFFSEQELRLIYQTIRYKQYRVLLLENILRDTLREEEKTVLFDNDLCEIINEVV